MSLSDVIRNIAKTVTDKEKAKELPLMVVQGTLSAAGQAMLLVDRMKNSIKGLGGKDKADDADSRPADDQAAVTAAEDRPARREPVIFAPRPSSKSEPNGTEKDKPEPVIFSPAAKPAATEPTSAEPTSAEPTAVEPAVEPEPKKAEPVVTEPAAVVGADEGAGTKAPDTPLEAAAKATTKAVTETAGQEPAQELAEQPVTPAKAAAKPRTPARARTSAAKPKAGTKPKATAETETPEPKAETAPAAAKPEVIGLVEPLPGYGDLTVASLRARMRGKSAEQISDLLAYEQATAKRPEVVRMFENRLAKLQAGE
ncbi:hypothetical protein [Nonomuraea indica]|uniref:hypothetical protein n=1 Tax=Nonomuraea indica TaxID=1581193 RepID=UPI000C7BA9A1|nr:hypothetical protein [Nonomuraea indica]